MGRRKSFQAWKNERLPAKLDLSYHSIFSLYVLQGHIKTNRTVNTRPSKHIRASAKASKPSSAEQGMRSQTLPSTTEKGLSSYTLPSTAKQELSSQQQAQQSRCWAGKPYLAAEHGLSIQTTTSTAEQRLSSQTSASTTEQVLSIQTSTSTPQQELSSQTLPSTAEQGLSSQTLPSTAERGLSSLILPSTAEQTLWGKQSFYILNLANNCSAAIYIIKPRTVGQRPSQILSIINCICSVYITWSRAVCFCLMLCILCTYVTYLAHLRAEL
jgi:hypothetical protein